MSQETRPIPRRAALFGLLFALIAVAAIVAGCEDLTSAPSDASSAAETTNPTTAPLDTMESAADSPAAQAEATTTELAAAPVDTDAAGEPPDVFLTEDDFSREVRLQVGERVRVDLTAKVAEKVVAVEWKYEPVIVQQTDIGTTEVSGFITGCWLELEALAEGRVTVRTVYERSNGTTRTLWVVYIQVLE